MTNNGTLAITPVTSAETKQAQQSCKFTISAVLRGFPIEISGEGRAADLQLIVSRLLDAGAEPPTAAKPEPTKPAGIPTSIVHHSPMKEGRKPGSWFCPKKVGDSYCKEVA